MPQFTAIITDNRFGETTIERQILEPLGVRLLEANCHLPSEVIAACGEADALLVNMANVDRQALESLPRCRVLARYGIGMDNVDTVAAAELGKKFYNVPDYCGEDAAQHALALLLALLRDLPARNAAVNAGKWNLPRDQYTVENKTVGVLGFGSSGKAFCRMMLALKPARLLVYSPHNHQQRLDDEIGQLAQLLGVELLSVSVEEIFKHSDIISIHLRLSDESRSLFNHNSLRLVKPGLFLVNIARGPIVDSDALRAALDSGLVAGAGLDVLEQEPPHSDHPLLQHPSVVFSDHCAYRSVTSLSLLRRRTAENAARGLGLL